jgi:hypothetical protein
VGQEAAIVAQFALDLAVTAQFRIHEIEHAKARQLLRLRIAPTVQHNTCRASPFTKHVVRKW